MRLTSSLGHGAAPTDQSLSAILVAVLGGAALSLSNVLSERAAQDAPANDSVLQQAICFSAWGLVAALASLFALHGRQLLAGTVAPLAGFGLGRSSVSQQARGPLGVVLSIAAADLSMTVFCMIDGLGANAYSVSRALAMVATPIVARFVLATKVPAAFAAASAIVAGGGYAYVRSASKR